MPCFLQAIGSLKELVADVLYLSDELCILSRVSTQYAYSYGLYHRKLKNLGQLDGMKTHVSCSEKY